MRERFVAVSVTGYGDGTRGKYESWSVLDTLVNHREVAKFYAERSGSFNDSRREAAARKMAAELNERARGPTL